MSDNFSITIITIVIIIITIFLTAFVINNIFNPNNLFIQVSSQSPSSQSPSSQLPSSQSPSSQSPSSQSPSSQSPSSQAGFKDLKNKKNKLNIALDYDNYSKTVNQETLLANNSDNHLTVNFLKNLFCGNNVDLNKILKVYGEYSEF